MSEREPEILSRNDVLAPPQSALPPQHRIWEKLIDALTYVTFLIIALFAALYHVEDKSFWIPYTAIVIGVLMRSRGKIDPEIILKLIGR
jgi:integral membrane sensor domain MASE1